eukprot:2701728-Pyramimonas_sp.AAC.1
MRSFRDLDHLRDSLAAEGWPPCRAAALGILIQRRRRRGQRIALLPSLGQDNNALPWGPLDWRQ